MAKTNAEHWAMMIKMNTSRDMLTGDYLVMIRIPQYLTRTDGEFKWRVIQALTLALTEKEARYGGSDTPEGLQALIEVMEEEPNHDTTKDR